MENEPGLKEMGHIRKKYVGKLSELMGSDSLVSKKELRFQKYQEGGTRERSLPAKTGG